MVLACRSQEKGEAAAFDIRQVSRGVAVLQPPPIRRQLFAPVCRRAATTRWSSCTWICPASSPSAGSPKPSCRPNPGWTSWSTTQVRARLLRGHAHLSGADLPPSPPAGVMSPGRTEDGFGMALGVNHLGHFLLTNLLLERLRRCGPSRVVTVAALLHRLGRVDFALLASRKDLVPGESTWSSFRAYCSSKLCNVLFSRELANRLEGTAVTCYSLHPGQSSRRRRRRQQSRARRLRCVFVAGLVYSDLGRSLSVWLQLLLLPLAKLFFADAEGGSQTVLHCALREGIEPLSGRYFSSCALQQVGAPGRDDAVAKKLWEVSERLTGLS